MGDVRDLLHVLASTDWSTCSRGSERDARDITYTLCRYWNRLDINRVPEHDMNHFVACHRPAALSWAALKRKYGM